MSDIKTTRFNHTYGGKIFPQTFGTVRLSNEEKYALGSHHSIVLKGEDMGIAVVVAVRTFQFKTIREPLTWLDANMSVPKFCAMLKRIYNNEVAGGINEETPFDHVIFSWHQRNLMAQKEYMAEYFDEIIRQQNTDLNNNHV